MVTAIPTFSQHLPNSWAYGAYLRDHAVSRAVHKSGPVDEGMAVILKRMLTSTQRMLPSAQKVADVVGALPLGIVVSHEENSIVVSLTGELDDATAPFLRETLAEITEGLNEELTLDIASLSFIDSTGLSLIVTLDKLLQHRGTRLVILSPTPSSRRLFELTGLAKILTIWPSI